MYSFESFILFMFTAAILVGISQKIRIPYPISLILGGTAIGFIPHLQRFSFDPQVILVIVLPPILYYAAFGTSIREFKQNIKEILSLALGLVIFTTVVIAIIFKWLFPEFPWALAFAFGAIVSPPDAIAATTILKRFEINQRLLTILEGESLINDASALVLYRIAITALLSETFFLEDAAFNFIKIVSGGILVGVILGFLMQKFSKNYLEPVVGVVFSFSIPYITYITADTLGVSGVLAVVVNGLIGSQILLRHHSSLRRIIGFATWDIFAILFNCFVFILIGLQLPILTKLMTAQQIVLYSGYGLLITCAMIFVRLIWIYGRSGVSYFLALKKPHADVHCPQILREAIIIGWSGMRGIVSLAAALALPLTTPNGMPLEGRNEVIFITFVVILLSLLIPGLTLAPLIKWLDIQYQPEQFRLHQVRKQLKIVAEQTLESLYASKKITEREFNFLHTYFDMRIKLAEVTLTGDKKLNNIEVARSLVVKEQRKKLFEIWEKLEVNDRQLLRLEHELDLEDTHFARAELK